MAGTDPGATFAVEIGRCDGYGIPKQQGKPNFAKMQKTRMNTGFSAARASEAVPVLQNSFIATLKLLFKFDRS